MTMLKMQESTTTHGDYYGATGRKIETEKSTCFAWQRKWKKRK